MSAWPAIVGCYPPPGTAASTVEQSDHETQPAQGGRYAAMFSQQYGDGLVEARCAPGLHMSDARVVETCPAT